MTACLLSILRVMHLFLVIKRSTANSFFPTFYLPFKLRYNCQQSRFSLFERNRRYAKAFPGKCLWIRCPTNRVLLNREKNVFTTPVTTSSQLDPIVRFSTNNACYFIRATNAPFRLWETLDKACAHPLLRHYAYGPRGPACWKMMHSPSLKMLLSPDGSNDGYTDSLIKCVFVLI